MKLSPLRTPLAVLREFVSRESGQHFGQKQLADLIGRSTATVQAIELGKLALSQDLAAVIEAKTGVSADWLLAGNLRRPMTNTYGARFTLDDFDLHRATASMPSPQFEDPMLAASHSMGLLFGERLAQVFAAAASMQPPMFSVVMHVVEEWLTKQEKRFSGDFTEYLEFRSRRLVRITDEDGDERVISGPVSPSRREVEVERFVRAIRETEGDALADETAKDLALKKRTPASQAGRSKPKRK